ncbi:MAG TPA: hypothetical protein VNL77_16945, partial [Roseiflexaceae bacterium]|nr:hypothetical protein [Roseiflexaceae bacterium]
PPPGADWCGDGAPCRMWLVETASGALSHIGEGERPHFAPRGDALAAHLSRDQPPTMREDALAVPLLWPAPDGPPLTLGAATPALWERAAWSADGRLLAAGHALATADGGTIEPLVDDEDTVANGISPDGGFVALAALTIVRSPEDDAGRKWTDLALLDRASGARRAIWRSDEEPGHGHYWRLSQVAWSPDGTLLTFTGCGTALATDGTASLKADARGCGVWVAAGDGSGLRLLPESAGAERPLEDALPPRFAPDGTALLFVRWEGPPDETARPSVWLWQAGAPAPTKVADGSMPAWRP